jgi:hypothetical protein
LEASSIIIRSMFGHGHHHHCHGPPPAPTMLQQEQATFKIFCRADEGYCLTVRNNAVILAPTDPRDLCQVQYTPYISISTVYSLRLVLVACMIYLSSQEQELIDDSINASWGGFLLHNMQHWFKDMRLSTKVKDSEGHPAFALVNRATGLAIKHSLGKSRPVQLVPYNPEYEDESVLWTESNDVGKGFRCVRMVNNTRLNLDAFHGDKDHGGVHDGTTVVLWEWAKGDNQSWKILPWGDEAYSAAGGYGYPYPVGGSQQAGAYPPPPPATYQEPGYGSYPAGGYAPPPPRQDRPGYGGDYRPPTPGGYGYSNLPRALASDSTVRIYCKADGGYSVTIRNGAVCLAPTNPRDEFQHWIKDMRRSTSIKDEEGYPAFALVNKVTGEAIKHSLGQSHPVCMSMHCFNNQTTNCVLFTCLLTDTHTRRSVWCLTTRTTWTSR